MVWRATPELRRFVIPQRAPRADMVGSRWTRVALMERQAALVAIAPGAHGRKHKEGGLETADVRHHLAPRRGEDDDDREAAPLWRRDPPGGFGQELAGAPSDDERLDGDRAPARDLD